MTEPDLWLRIGRDHDAQVMFIGPLFEEHNRMRRSLVAAARTLDGAGIGSVFPDFTGMGENPCPVSEASVERWRDDAARAADGVRPTVIASIRGGALIDGRCTAHGWWRFAPETGARLARDLRRTQLAGETDLFAGHRLSAEMFDQLEAATPEPVAQLRTVRLASDPADADARIDAPPLWRRAEPGEDRALSDAIAADLLGWIETCAAR